MKSLLIKKLFIYLIFTFIVFLTLLIYSLILYKNDNLFINNEKELYIYTFIIGGICFFILGLLKGIFIKKNGLLEGICASAVVITIALLCNLFIKRPFQLVNITKIIVFILLSGIGGIIGVNIKKIKQSI